MLTRPILRYHGGKWMLAPWIIENLPSHRVYVEPFGGAASVLLRKPRSFAEIYNDLDNELVTLFKVCRDRGEELQRALQLTPFSREEFRLSYETADDDFEQARRTVVRAFMGFGSNAHSQLTGFRGNSNRSGRSPARDWQNYPDALSAICERLQGVVIENRCAIEAISTHDSDETVHYVDPPYVAATRDAGCDYKYEMTDAQHEDLAQCLGSLRGSVVLSGYESDLYNDLYKGWKKITENAFADGARARVEVLWLSPNCPSHGLFDMFD